MKFFVRDKVVTVCGEEDYAVSNLSTFQYIEIEGEVHETPFQALETIQVVKTPCQEVYKAKVSMTSYKQDQATMESGHPEDWVEFWIFL